MTSVGVRELRQHLNRYLDRVKAGETLVVTKRGRPIARLVPAASAGYEELVEGFGVRPPTQTLEEAIAKLPKRSFPAGTTDAFLEESRRDRF